jgi:threonine/homoserine/homoserine lactone efflux protein
MDALMLPEIAGLLAIWLLAIVSPGPAFLVVSQAAVGRSRPTALGVALGISVGTTIYAALTLWGFTALVTQISWMGTVMRLVGAVYLVYLGLALFHGTSAPAEPELATPTSADARAGFRLGMLTALTNPKAIAFYLSLFAVALPPDMPHAAKVILLAAGFSLEIAWYALVALALSTGGPRRLYARAKRTIDRVLGAALLLIGVRLGAGH